MVESADSALEWAKLRADPMKIGVGLGPYYFLGVILLTLTHTHPPLGSIVRELNPKFCQKHILPCIESILLMFFFIILG